MDLTKINILRDKINKLLIKANKKPEYNNYIKYMNRIQENSDLYIFSRIDQISEKITKIEDELVPKIMQLGRSFIYRGSDEHYLSITRNGADDLLKKLNDYCGKNTKKEDQLIYLMKIKQSDDIEILTNKHLISAAIAQIERELNDLYYKITY
jgi:hypothetical protein